MTDLQKPTQHCKAITFQLKNKFKKRLMWILRKIEDNWCQESRDWKERYSFQLALISKILIRNKVIQVDSNPEWGKIQIYKKNWRVDSR